MSSYCTSRDKELSKPNRKTKDINPRYNIEVTRNTLRCYRGRQRDEDRGTRTEGRRQRDEDRGTRTEGRRHGNEDRWPQLGMDGHNATLRLERKAKEDGESKMDEGEETRNEMRHLGHSVDKHEDRILAA